MAEFIVAFGSAAAAALIGLAARCVIQRIQAAGNCRCSCASGDDGSLQCSCLNGKAKAEEAKKLEPPTAQRMDHDAHASTDSIRTPIPVSRFVVNRDRRLRQQQSAVDLDQVVQRQILHSMVRCSQAKAAVAQALSSESIPVVHLKLADGSNSSSGDSSPENRAQLTGSLSTSVVRGGDGSRRPVSDRPSTGIPLRDVVQSIVEKRRRKRQSQH